MGTCRFCQQPAGFLRKQHGQCRDLHTKGMLERTEFASQASGGSGSNEADLRNTIRMNATRARATEDDISGTVG